MKQMKHADLVASAKRYRGPACSLRLRQEWSVRVCTGVRSCVHAARSRSGEILGLLAGHGRSEARFEPADVRVRVPGT